MNVTTDTLLAELPPFRDQSVIVNNVQTVKDIISEICTAQMEFAPFYDKIALYFDGSTVSKICNNIYRFEENNFHYREETEHDQTTGIPAAILTRGGNPGIGIDCKHYALFAAGILAGINRLTDKKIDWEFRFASYQLAQPIPYHVFVVVRDKGSEIWIDPTPGANGKIPVWAINKKVKKSDMPLRRIVAGFGNIGVDTSEDIERVPQYLRGPIELLLDNGVLNADGSFNASRLKGLWETLPDNEFAELETAVTTIVNASGTIGNWFDDAFKFIQQNAAILGMQVPRGSFLALVDTNAFHYADKLKKALDYPDAHAALQDKWERLGGKFSKLVEYIGKGAGKKPIVSGAGSIGDPATGTAAIIASAAVIVAAIIPLITTILNKHKDPVVNLTPVGADGLPVGYSSGGIMSFVQQNAVLLLAAAALGTYYYVND